MAVRGPTDERMVNGRRSFGALARASGLHPRGNRTVTEAWVNGR